VCPFVTLMEHRCRGKNGTESFVKKSYTNNVIYKSQRQSSGKNFNDSFTTGNKKYENTL
jgi:hypothetical protein